MEIAVIASRLPYIDRRSLSEAWFSALHLASDAPLASHVPERRTAAVASASGHVAPRRGTARPPASTHGQLLPNRAPRTRTLVGESFAPRDVRRTARTGHAHVLARSYPAFRTSLTVGVAKERVQLLLRREGATLHVVALCRPEIAELVRRALACAGAHLRTRGETMRASVQTLANMVRA